MDATGMLNVGTVLFSKNHVHNTTWPQKKLALLRARLYTQHLIPPLSPPKTPEFVDTLLTYFNNCYTSIHHESPDSETEQILTTAFTDVIGGYLKMFALPLTKYGYYGGTLPKKDAMKLFLFYEDVKKFLGNDGQGWNGPALPILNSMTINVAPPPFSYTRRELLVDPCKHLSYFLRTPRGLAIPTPVIDWTTATMFVPLANQTLVNLYSPNMTNTLHKYYDVASHCVRSERPSNLVCFNDRFQTWLLGDVVPHLNDDTLYTALEGVLSLVNSTNSLNAHTVYHDIGKNLNIIPDHHMFSTKMIIVFVIIAIELIWCLLTLMCLLCRRKKDRKIRVGINTILETRAHRRSDSESCYFGQDMSTLRFKRRRGGFMFEQRPNEAMEVGEVYSGRTVCAVGTNTRGRWVEHRPEAATMVDEAPKKITATQTRIFKRHMRINASAQNELKLPSDGSSKTATLLLQSPAKATTLRLSRPSKKSDASVKSCPRDSLVPLCSPCISKQNTKIPSKGSETSVALLTAELPPSVERICPAPVERASKSKEVVVEAQTEIERASSAKPVKRTRRSSKSLKAVTDGKSLVTQVEKKPFVGIRIERPQRETRVDVSKYGDGTKVKRPKMSQIPKKAKGSSPRVIRGSGSNAVKTVVRATATSTKMVAHKSLIPRLKNAADDIVLLREVGTKAPKLNVTL